MTGLFIALGVALLVFLFLQARLGARVWTTPDAYEVRLRWGLFSFRLLPPKAPKRPKRARRLEKKTEEPKQAEKRPAVAPDRMLDLFPAFRRAAGRLIRGFRIERLYFHMVVATGDAAQTAMLYGAVYAGLGMIAPLTGKVKDADITVGVDYTLPAPKIYLSTALSIRTGTLLAVGLSLLLAVWRHRERA